MNSVKNLPILCIPVNFGNRIAPSPRPYILSGRVSEFSFAFMREDNIIDKYIKESI